eukprot:COSAG05_NODE_10902_length_540_cov_0.807256_1_plen_67_part_01
MGITWLNVGGMKCEGCVKGVTKALETVPAVESASVELEGSTPGRSCAGGTATVVGGEPHALVAAVQA